MCPETQNLADADERSQGKIKLRLEVAAGNASELDALVFAVSEAYRKFFAWELIVAQAEIDSIEDGHSREKPIKDLSSYATNIPAEDEPHVEKTRATAPVELEITGAPGPLQRLQWYFANRHVEWDRQAKEPSEDRRLELEKQRTDAVRQQVDLLHDLGFPEIQIREALSQYIFGPLDRLEHFADLKFIVPEPRQKENPS
jgi:hypothetical protein